MAHVVQIIIKRSQPCSHNPSALDAGAPEQGDLAMPQPCYLAKGAKRPSNILDMPIVLKNSFPEYFVEIQLSSGVYQVVKLFGAIV